MMRRPHFRPAVRLVFVALLAGCAVANPQAIRAIVQPYAPPVRTVTSFTEAQHCLDGLLLAAGRAPVVLSSSEVTDFTRRIAVSGDDMLVNAISQINRRSGALSFSTRRGPARPAWSIS
jgi:type IV pilus biogenesis protein CpaD/CtpE